MNWIFGTNIRFIYQEGNIPFNKNLSNNSDLLSFYLSEDERKVLHGDAHRFDYEVLHPSLGIKLLNLSCRMKFVLSSPNTPKKCIDYSEGVCQ